LQSNVEKMNKKFVVAVQIIALFLSLVLLNINPAGGAPSSIVSTTSDSKGTYAPSQRKSFYANGYHYVAFCGGTNLKLYNSPDGVTWTQIATGIGADIQAASNGREFSMFYSPTYGVFDIVSAMETTVDRIMYQRATPNADGSVSFMPEKVIIPPWEDEDGVDGGASRGTNIIPAYRYLLVPGTDIYVLDRDAWDHPTDLSTEINITTYGAGSFFVFNPYKLGSYVGTSLPANPQSKGWMYGDYLEGAPKKLWSLDGEIEVRTRLVNPDSIAHAGNIHARLWVADAPDLTGAVLLGSDYTSVSFDGTAGQGVLIELYVEFDLGVGDAFAFKGKYLYLEFFWEVTTAATNARVQMDTGYGYTRIYATYHVIYFPTVTIDSDGYPWVGFGRANGISIYPYIVKANANNGTPVFRFSTVYKLSAVRAVRWSVTPIALTTGKVYVLYMRPAILGAPYYIYGKLWDGVTWGAEEDLNALIGLTTEGPAVSPFYISAVSIGDDVHLVALERVSYDIEYTKRDYASGSWSALVTVQAGTTSTSAPVLSKRGSTELYCFWAGSPSADYIYYKKFDVATGVWDASPTVLIAETEALTGNDRLSSYYEVVGDILGVMYMTLTASPYNVKYEFMSFVVGYSLSLHIFDWDLTDPIQNAYVYVNGSLQISDANGWANYTALSAGTYLIYVTYYGFPVNGTFSIVLSSDTIIDVQCKLYDVYAYVLPANLQGVLYLANVTVFNSTSVAANKIASSISNESGIVTFQNLPNNTLTFTAYADSTYTTVIANVTRTVTSEDQMLTDIVCNQNYGNVQIPWQITYVSVVLLEEKVKKLKRYKNKICRLIQRISFTF